jgi:hypothetical protein
MTTLIRRALSAADLALSQGAQETRLFNAANAADGSGMVRHGQAVNYAAGALGAHASLMEVRDVTQFPWLADKTGTLDAGAAINAALLASNGRWRVVVPGGVFLLTTPIQANEQTGLAIARAAVHFEGAGVGKTVFINRSGDYAIKHTVTLAQSNAHAKAYNGFMGGFTIKTDGASPAGSAGMTLEAFWMGRVEDVQIESPKGRGINVARNGALNANSDSYSCGNLHLQRVTVSSATGVGIYHDNPGTTLFSEGHYVVNCTLGGIYTCGANGAIDNGAVAGNLLFGIKVAYTTTTPHNLSVRGNEIDNNAGRQVIVEGYHCCVEQNRFIQTETAGAFPATDGVYIDSTVSGGASENVVGRNLMDVRSRVSGVHNWVTTTDTAGTTANRVEETVFSATGGLTKYNFLGSTRVRNIASENGLIVANSAITPVGKGAVAVVAIGSSQALSTTAATKIAFVTERSDESNAWDTVNNRFLVPHKGLLRISGAFLGIAQSPAGVPFQIHVYKNGVVEHTLEFPRGLFSTSVAEHIPLSVALRAAAGDYFELFGQCGTASRVTFTSSNFATVTFEML